MSNNIVLKQKVSEFDDELSDQALDRLASPPPPCGCASSAGSCAYTAGAIPADPQ
jgi:hypothetical protein